MEGVTTAADEAFAEVRFSASIQRIRTDARIFPGDKESVPFSARAGFDPAGFIRNLMAQQEKRGEKYEKGEILPFGEFSLWIHTCRTERSTPVVRAISAAYKRLRVGLGPTAQAFSAEGLAKVSVHVIFFLWRPLPTSGGIHELYALTTGTGWKVVRPYCDNRFVTGLLTTQADPLLSTFEYRTLAGSRQAVREIFATEEPYSLEGNELQSLWQIFKRGTFTLKPTSLLFQNEALKVCQKTGIKLIVGASQLAIHRSLGLSEYQELLLTCSEILGQPESDTPHPAFRYLTNIVKVYDPQVQADLDEKLKWRLYQLYRGEPLPVPTIMHKLYDDYVRAHYFALSKRFDEIHRFTLAPTFAELISWVRDRSGTEMEFKAFKRSFGRYTLSFATVNAPLLDLIQTEIEHNGEIYFRRDKGWYQIRGEQMAILWRQFYKASKEFLLPPDHQAALKLPWLAKGEWAAFSREQAQEETGLTYEEVDEGLARLEKESFSCVNAQGTVEVSELTQEVVRSCGKQDKEHLKRVWGVLRHLLATQATLSEQILLQAFKDAKLSDSKAEAAAKSGWSLLTQQFPLTKKIAGTEVKGCCLGSSGQVLFPYLSRVTGWTHAGLQDPHRRRNIERLLKKIQREKRSVTTQDLVHYTRGTRNTGSPPSVVLKDLKTEVRTLSPAHVAICGPLPNHVRQQLDERLAIYLDGAYRRYAGAMGEGPYNERYLDEEDFLVFDRSYFDKKKKVELFDLLHIGKDGKLYLYHVKAGFDHVVRDGSSQIRNGAQLLQGSDRNRLLGDLFDAAVSPDVKTPHRLLLKAKLDALGRQAFLDLFNRKIVYVYAFLDTAGNRERLLSDHPDPDVPVSNEEIAHIIPLKQLVEAGYLDETNRPTGKALLAAEGDYRQAFGQEVGSSLYQTFRSRMPPYDSVVAPVELLQLRHELRNRHVDFCVCQIPRPKGGDSLQPLLPRPVLTTYAALSLPPSPPLDAGFCNGTNSCFAIAALQVLTTSPYISQLTPQLSGWSSYREHEPQALVQKALAKALVARQQQQSSGGSVGNELVMDLLEAVQGWYPEATNQPWDNRWFHDFLEFFGQAVQALDLAQGEQLFLFDFTRHTTLDSFITDHFPQTPDSLLPIGLNRAQQTGPVPIPPRLDLYGQSYGLVAATVYIQSPPHYIIYKKAGNGSVGRWVQCDDDLITPIALEQVQDRLDNEAVFVLYQKGADPLPPASQQTPPRGSQPSPSRKNKRKEPPQRTTLDKLWKRT